MSTSSTKTQVHLSESFVSFRIEFDEGVLSEMLTAFAKPLLLPVEEHALPVMV